MARLLLVDDARDNLRTLSRWLTRRGFEVIQADDGLEAVEKAGRDSPDLILMDARLPRLSGLEATRRLKANPATAGIPVIVHSCDTASQVEAEALAAGAVSFLGKPFGIDQVVAIINRVLGGPGTPAGADRSATPPTERRPES